METGRPLWLTPLWLENILISEKEPSRSQVECILAKSLSMQNLSVEEAALLMKIKDPSLKRLVRETATKVKLKAYGDRIVLTAPVHLTNLCDCECSYCASRASNPYIERKKLSMDEIRKITLNLVRQGHKRVVIAVPHVSGADIDYIAEAVEAITSVHDGCGEIRSIDLKAEGLDEEEFIHLKELWNVGVVIVFQETYYEKSYAASHTAGPKANFVSHLQVPDTIIKAGHEDVGFGLLLGLGPWKFDVLAMIQHADHLVQSYGLIPHTVNLIRLCRVPGSLVWPAPYSLSDEEFLDCVALVRLAIPNTGIVISTREPGEMWKQACNMGASQLYTGSLANPYEAWSEVPNQTVPFPTLEEYHLEEAVRYLIEEAGHMPSFCSACSRLGRSGREFMDMVSSCGMSSQCWPNSAASFLEFLSHYATPHTRKVGEELIARKLEAMSVAEKQIALDLLSQVRKGRLDVFV